jgi:hypothetical protein
MLFASVTGLAEGLSLETADVKVGKTPNFFLVGTWRPTASIMEKQLIFFLKTLIELKRQDIVI